MDADAGRVDAVGFPLGVPAERRARPGSRLVWLAVGVGVVALCRMAARGDSDPAGATQSPRLPSTCGTVRSRIFRSPHSDQFATYR